MATKNQSPLRKAVDPYDDRAPITVQDAVEALARNWKRIQDLRALQEMILAAIRPAMEQAGPGKSHSFVVNTYRTPTGVVSLCLGEGHDPAVLFTFHPADREDMGKFILEDPDKPEMAEPIEDAAVPSS